MACKCGRRLYVSTEVDRGTCNACHMDAGVVVSQDNVVSQVVSPVVSQGKSRQQRWREAHPDQWRLIHRDGQRRRRTVSDVSD